MMLWTTDDVERLPYGCIITDGLARVFRTAAIHTASGEPRVILTYTRAGHHIFPVDLEYPAAVTSWPQQNRNNQ
ncbi:hypothetical protein G4X40_18715 [Rhodococcus sp. D2-41]|uniref:hypothetical protein n=1 Tax=Speluncibacter jeojiensis TaxID=2710754 RepID=UPI00240F3ED8|nr:hypothetical protein [Rhodococcus sp. D2-41]MDG3012177.1 hypothetical protein [Rhodococcus sp. D2-41]